MFEAYPSELKRGGGKYCSPDCNYEAKNKQINRTCQECGKEFSASRSRVKKGEGKYCSLQCARDARDVRVEQKCEFCEKEFKVYRCKVPQGLGRFCSKQCFNEYKKANSKKHCKCLQCGKNFKVYLGWIKKGGGKYCSSDCSAKAHSGKNSNLWKGGHINYYGPNWQKQRRKARKRDGNKCKYCSKTEKQNGKKLDVHHIKPFREFNYIPDKNNNYKKANKLTNLICLCTGCHKLAEHGNIAIQPYMI